MMIRGKFVCVVALVIVAMLAGCGADIAGTNPVDEVADDLAQAGGVTVSIAPEVAARALSDRFLFDDVLVQFRRASDDAVARQAVLTLANPSVTRAASALWLRHAVRKMGCLHRRKSTVTIVARKTVKVTIKIATTAEAEWSRPRLAAQPLPPPPRGSF